MRFLLLLVLLVAGILGGVWLGGESWLTGRASALIGQREDMSAGSIAPLREMGRIGLRAEQVEYSGHLSGMPADLSLPWVDIWVPPMAPNAVHATLPEQAVLVLNDGAPVDLGLAGAQVMMRVSPANDMAISRAAIAAGQITVAGQPAVEGLSGRVDLVGLGHDAPRAAGAAYDVVLRLDRLDPAALAMLGLPAPVLPGDLAVQGDLRLWLTAPPRAGAPQGGQPQPIGFNTRGLSLSMGDLRARLVGEVRPDDQGRASGRLALYTADADGWLQAAADAGMIPPSGVMLGGAVLRNLSQMPLNPEAPAETSNRAANGTTMRLATGFLFPEPAADEMRLPIILRDGQVFLGNIPIGSAPQLLGDQAQRRGPDRATASILGRG
ncbi:DUF2125 domain-containing protein [Paracoccus sp. M683]|uniref:DUF2125 domain-containing protein n=1 Tax=Paracoccus sp. M683 TaxID=2594268 RepID=UPI00163DA572|nr:DUF2125 domain-containing protein [Paracoccus sp. M683]